MRNLVPTGTYQHYKGGIYFVHYVGKHTETEELVVIYSGINGDVWVRPLDMWFEDVEYKGETVTRFTKF
jgi:hypothetical protein